MPTERKFKNFEDLHEYLRTEQVLAVFGITPDSNGKILCIEHEETEPSAQVYEKGLYCFGCKKNWNSYTLARFLLEKTEGKHYNYEEMFEWFNTTDFPEASDTVYEEVKYEGPVPQAFISYWHSCLVDHSYDVLLKERLLNAKTVDTYQLGWRPDFGAWSIPFFRGEPGHSDVDIVQFRMVEGSPKYIGLRGHNRGSVMNAHLLETEQPYLVVLLGAFDSILALQDGVIAVGLNGSMPFKKTEKKRVQELFAKQKNIIIVPDNTLSEFKPAHQLADWLHGKVVYLPRELPEGTDYIDYRKLGYTSYDFKHDILHLDFPVDLVENIVELLKVGDPMNLARHHAVACVHKCQPDYFAGEVIKRGPLNYTYLQWSNMAKLLSQVKDSDTLFENMGKVSQLAYSYLGGW